MLLPKLREEVCKCNLMLPANDLVRMTSGNVSGRDRETGWMVIKPSGVPYEELTPENMVIVGPDQEIIEGDLTPSIDTITHLYVYRHRPDVFGIVHTHSPYATSFAVLGRGLPACLTTCGLVGGKVPLGSYAPPIGQDNIGKEMLRIIGDAYAVIMRSHGVFTIGHSASHATRVAVEVEEIARITHLALLIGEPIELTEEQVAEVAYIYDHKYGQKVREPAS